MKPLQAFELLKSAEKKYNFSDGFKLLYCPWDNISSSNIAFISLNPGNAPENAELRMVSDERGNSYEIEMDITKSPINEQFMKLCDFLENKPSDFLTGAAIPFRSKNWESLNKEQKIAGVEIGVSLWKELLGSNVKKIIVTGEEACKTVLKIKSAELKLSIPSKWGNSYLKKYVATDETEIFSIPHCLQVKHANRTGVAGGRRSAVHRRKCPQAPHDPAAARAPRAPSAIRPANPRSRCAASTPRRAVRGEGTTRSSTRSYQLRPTAPGWSVGDAASCQDTAVDRRVAGRPCGGGS